jgi:hypothetical protein
LGQHLSRSVKFVPILHFPIFLWTITTFASHYEYLTSLINPASNNLCTLAFAASIFSSHILWSFYFLGFACRLTCNLCLITSVLTPTRSEVDHMKTSMFLSRNCRRSACFYELISMQMHNTLSGALVLSATLLKSVKISFLDEGCSCSCCSVSSLKKCPFVAWDQTTLAISSFLLTAENYYYAKGCWDLEVEIA